RHDELVKRKRSSPYNAPVATRYEAQSKLDGDALAIEWCMDQKQLRDDTALGFHLELGNSPRHKQTVLQLEKMSMSRTGLA
ncbi:hypothetical protein H0H93_011647, partial [Arthromyces matolae]